MRRMWLSCATLFFGLAGVAGAQQPATHPVERLSPALDRLVSPDAKLTLVRGGFGFTEGIAWNVAGGYLVVSDMPANVIFKLTPDGKRSLYLDHSGYTGYDIWRVGFMQTNGKDPKDPKFERFPMIGSNGMAFDNQGRLVICTWAGRSIDRIEKDGRRVTLTDNFEGKKFNGTNDLVIKKDGAIYFTDGFGGLRLRQKDPRKGLNYSAVFLWKDGKTSLAIKDIRNTNGLALSPDEKILYANGSADKFVRAYDVRPDDTLSDSRLLIDMSGDKRKGITDGMKVDARGDIWESGPGGIWILSPNGQHLGTIDTPELVANLAFGDADLRTLYIAARTGVYKIRTRVPGLR